jgi:hypothetical protein
MANAVTLTFAADTASIERGFKTVEKGAADVGKSLDGVKSHAESGADGFEHAGEAMEGATKHFRGGKDAIDGMSTALGAFGVAIPGPIGGVMQFAGGMADLADGIGTTVLPALKALKAATLATLGPWGLAAVAVVAIGAALFVAYKKSETFRDVVHKLGDGLAAFGKASLKVASVLATPYILAFKAIAAAWNNTLGGLHVHIPGVHLPGFMGGGGFDGVDFGIPNIPTFANGGVSNGGLALVGERGPELVALPGASRVIPNNQLGGSGGGQPIIIELHGDLVGAVRKAVRVQGGGNVQLAFGR